jgi:cytochrome c-type biogenesis protein CcmH/NrfG
LVLGALLSKQARYGEAIPFLEEAGRANPKHSEALYELARARWKKGMLRESEHAAQAAIKYDPKNRSAHYLLAQIAKQTGDQQTAERESSIAAALSEQESARDVFRLSALRQKAVNPVW